MKVNILYALLASAVFYGVGSYLFWVNKTIEEEQEDLPAVCSKCRDFKLPVELAVHLNIKSAAEGRSECQDFKPPPVQVIDDVGKKCD